MLGLAKRVGARFGIWQSTYYFDWHHQLVILIILLNRILLTSTSEVYGDPLVHPQPESYWGNVNPIGRFSSPINPVILCIMYKLVTIYLITNCNKRCIFIEENRKIFLFVLIFFKIALNFDQGIYTNVYCIWHVQNAIMISLRTYLRQIVNRPNFFPWSLS